MTADLNDERAAPRREPFVGPHILRAPLHDLLADELPADLQASIARLRIETDRRRAAEKANARRRSFRKSMSDGLFYAVVVAFGAWIVSMVADRAPPTETKVEIITPQVRPGEDLKMRVEPNRHRLCEAKIIFRVYDKDGNIISTAETRDWAMPVGGLGFDKPFIRPIRISSDAVPSLHVNDARMRIERKYRCPFNLVHFVWPITEVTPDMPFTIQPKVAR